MKSLIFSLLLAITANASASNLEIGGVNGWKLQIVTEKTPITEALGNPVAILSLPEMENGYIPAVTVHKLAVPAGFNEADISQWQAVVLGERKETKSIDIERLSVKNEKKNRYIAEIRFSQKSESMTNASYLGMRAGNDIIVFKFIADREYYMPNVSAVRALFTSVTVDSK